MSSEAEPATQKVAIDTRGDLTLKCQNMEFVVCSHTVFRASPGLQKLARDLCVDAPGAKYLTLDVATDSAALRVILDCIHGLFTAVYPKLHDQKLFLRVLETAKKYEMTPAIGPIARTWLSKTYKKESSDDDYLSTQLLISHELGHISSIRQVMQRMAKFSSVDDKANLFAEHRTDFDPYDKILPVEMSGLLGMKPHLSSSEH